MRVVSAQAGSVGVMTQVPDWIATGECQTRDGREVRIYATDGGGDFPVHGAAREYSGWCECSWCQNGRYFVDGDLSADDIIPIPKEPVVSKEPIGIKYYMDIMGNVIFEQKLPGAEITRDPDTNKILKVHWEAE